MMIIMFFVKRQIVNKEQMKEIMNIVKALKKMECTNDNTDMKDYVCDMLQDAIQKVVVNEQRRHVSNYQDKRIISQW